MKKRLHPLTVLVLAFVFEAVALLMFWGPMGVPKGPEVAVWIPIVAGLSLFVFLGWLVWVLSVHVNDSRKQSA